MTIAPILPNSFGIAGEGLGRLRKGDLMAIRSPGGEGCLLRITDIKQTPDADRPWPGGVTLTAETVSEPVPAAQYPDPIPREDQDSAHARCAPVRGAEVPADQVRPAADAPGGRDDR